MLIDFRDGKTFPRRGREPLGGFLWLPRVVDKARAAANKTLDGYIYPCPMDRGVMQRWGITPREFNVALASRQTDDSILDWIRQRVPADQMQVANDWVLAHKDNLDQQDWEEGFLATRPAGAILGPIGAAIIITAVLSTVIWIALRLTHLMVAH